MAVPQLNDAKVYEAVLTAAQTVTGLERVLWPLDASLEVPEAGITAVKHWLLFTGLNLEPDPRSDQRGSDVYRIVVECTLVTLCPESESVYTHATKVLAVCNALADRSYADAGTVVRLNMDKAARRMVAREGLEGRGMATDITIAGTVQQVAAS